VTQVQPDTSSWHFAANFKPTSLYCTVYLVASLRLGRWFNFLWGLIENQLSIDSFGNRTWRGIKSSNFTWLDWKIDGICTYCGDWHLNLQFPPKHVRTSFLKKKAAILLVKKRHLATTYWTWWFSHLANNRRGTIAWENCVCVLQCPLLSLFGIENLFFLFTSGLQGVLNFRLSNIGNLSLCRIPTTEQSAREW
jgi:hypothetical protein